MQQLYKELKAPSEYLSNLILLKSVSKLVCKSVYKLATHNPCYIIAEGFRFMPLSLIRLRTFRLSTWVS